MIIQSQIVKSKSDLQAAIQKLKISKASLYEGVNKKSFYEIANLNSNSKKIILVVIESN